ncbi:phage protease [Azospirillum cavernae]|nr:phage protease [Azospirillum cavernae]
MNSPRPIQPHPALRLSMASSSGAADVVAFSVLVSSLPELASATSGWIKLAPLGVVCGRDGRGPYNFGNQTQAAAIVAASKAYAGPTDPLIDYDHAFDLSASRGLGNAPAAGWIKDLDVRADGIYARVEWTKAAAVKMKRGEYRYVSPTFNHAADGTVVRILRAGLTNHPNFNLPALAAATPHQEPVMDPTLAALCAALGMPVGTDVNAAISRVHALTAASAAARADFDRIATAAGLSVGAEPTAIAAAVSADPDPKAWVPMATYTAAAATLAELQGQTLEREATAAVDKAVTEGKVAPATREHFLKVYRADPSGWTAFAAALPVVVPPGKTAGGGVSGQPSGGSVTGALDDGQKSVLAMMGVDPAKAAKVMEEMGWAS